MTTLVTPQIADTGDMLIAHHQQVVHIVATGGGPDGRWSATIRNGDSYSFTSKDAARTALEAAKVAPVPGLDLCTDRTCCLSCEHGGDKHSAGECWKLPTRSERQCDCGWYTPVGMEHRHIAPAWVDAS